MDTTFVDELASAAPTPGGGGAAAYVGALAAALACMVGNLTVGKKAYVGVEGQVREQLASLEALRARLLSLVDADARAFGPLAAAYRMPKDTPEQQAAKHDALQAALAGACDVPLAIMRETAEVLDACEYLAHHGSKIALSDVGAAVAFVRAAVDGASLNILINAASMEDAARAERYRAEVRSLCDGVQARCDALFAFVREAVS